MSGRAWTAAERAVLATRTRALAAPLAEVEPTATESVVVLAMGPERCAIPTSFVHGIVRLAHLARLPGVERHVAGLFAYQGEVLVAFHLHALLDASLAALPEYARVVLVGRDAPEAALVVERVEAIAAVDMSDLREPPPEISARTRRILLGVDPHGVPVVDGTALMASDALFVSRGGPDRRGHR